MMYKRLSPAQIEVLVALGNGEELWPGPNGGVILSRSKRKVAPRTFAALLRRGLITQPDAPLFGDSPGVLTDSGRAELQHL